MAFLQRESNDEPSCHQNELLVQARLKVERTGLILMQELRGMWPRPGIKLSTPQRKNVMLRRFGEDENGRLAAWTGSLPGRW